MDNVRKPKHYQSPYPMRNGQYLEVLDVIIAFGLNFNMGNVAKYLLRCDKKGAHMEDIQKLQQYADFEIASLLNSSVKDPNINGCDAHPMVAAVLDKAHLLSEVTYLEDAAPKRKQKKQRRVKASEKDRLDKQRAYQKAWRAKQKKKK